MSDTPETDACWDDKECNILEHARRLERELEEQARLLGMSAERECDLRGKLERERALADRLAEAATKSSNVIGPPDKVEWSTDDELNDAWDCSQLALAAWKEARSEV